jgi:hypothetical protein
MSTIQCFSREPLNLQNLLSALLTRNAVMGFNAMTVMKSVSESEKLGVCSLPTTIEFFQI